MSKELISKKLEQIKKLLEQLEILLHKPLKEFREDFTIVRSAERNFQLVVDLASDINTQLLVEKGEKTPDTYKQSFTEIAGLGILTPELSNRLTETAKIRNILVHEYDFEEDYERFYLSAKKLLPAYKEYIKNIYEYINR